MTVFRGHTPMSIARRVQTGVDRYNDPIYTTADTRFLGELVPLDSTENLVRADQVFQSFRVFLPVLNPAPAASDKVKVDGLVYELTGTPKPVRILGRLHHFEAVALRVTG